MPLKSLLSAALVIVGLLAAAPASAHRGESHQAARNMYGQTFELQNYFDPDVDSDDPSELVPFFDSIKGRVNGKVEVDPAKQDYIYEFDIEKNSIAMSWNVGPQWDQFEPYVGAISGASQEEAAASPIADQYWFEFSKPISGFNVMADPSMPLVPDVFFADDHTLVISVPGGTSIGDGFDARITLSPPVRSIKGLDFELQNYFDADTGDDDPATLIPFFDQISGTVGHGVEVTDYIYDINLRNRAITLRWNRAPEWDQFEPYVGAISGASQEEAAASPIADQYWITFTEKVSHLELSAASNKKLVPDVYFADDYTVVVSIPGGTNIGDGFNARINIGRSH